MTKPTPFSLFSLVALALGAGAMAPSTSATSGTQFSTSRTPLGTSSEANGVLPAGGTCVESMRDQAMPNDCMAASSTPTLGMLYPISPELFVDQAGNVGLGTTTPLARLDVQGNGTFQGDVTSANARFVATDANSTTTVRLDSYNHAFGNPGGGTLRLFDLQGDLGVNIVADEFIDSPAISLLDSAGRSTVRIEGNAISGPGGGSVRLMDSAGNTTLTLMGETGTTTTKILTITGGADIAEPFDVSTEAPAGTVLCIDPEQVGRLRVSSEAYDRTLAGVASGANGIEAGLVLRKDDSIATGSVLVALTGRVYVRCSTENGVIRPGDLLTSATLAGHAMRATESERSFGAVLGKAMSSLDEETGMVLVLVNLQ